MNFELLTLSKQGQSVIHADLDYILETFKQKFSGLVITYLSIVSTANIDKNDPSTCMYSQQDAIYLSSPDQVSSTIN